MQELSFSQMEETQGGKGCGKWGAAMAIAGGVLTVAAFAFPPAGLLAGLSMAYGMSFGIAGVGCGIAELAS